MQDREMPLEGHLEELRTRIGVMAGSVLAGFLAGYFVARPVLYWVMARVGVHHVVAIGVTETFFAILKVAFVIGILLASPIILYQLAAFILPGLLPHERRVLYWVFGPGILLFVAGMAGGFFWIVPIVLHIMMSFTGHGIEALFSISSLLSFVITLTVPFGIVAELPLVAGVLARFGLVSPRWFERQRRYAVVLAFLLAAILAPPDALSMILMAVPIYLIYELSALVVRITWRERSSGFDSGPGVGGIGPDDEV
jgi:sec-independent protein translocase protein TatC